MCSYIISQGDVRCLGVLVELMMGVCDPTVLNGESGYYLTVLGAALSVSKRVSLPNSIPPDRMVCDTAAQSPILDNLALTRRAHVCTVPANAVPEPDCEPKPEPKPPAEPCSTRTAGDCAAA